MTRGASRRRDRREVNPAFSTRRLKLDTFQTNLDSGCVMSDLDGRLDISWPSTLALARLAEEMELEALVRVARWQGFGGATNPQGAGFEAYAGRRHRRQHGRRVRHLAHLAQSPDHRRQAVDRDRSYFRRALRAQHQEVAPNQPEIDMFGTAMMGHQDPGLVKEWLAIVKRLWTEDETFDHEGRFYKITKGCLQPKPIQSPYPAIMNAGASERGRHFATKYADSMLILLLPHRCWKECRAHVQAYHKLAREEYGREVRVWTVANIVQGEQSSKEPRFLSLLCAREG